MLSASTCADIARAKQAWHGWHLCLMLPLPAGRSRRALVHCLKMLSYSAPPSAYYNLVLTYNALPFYKVLHCWCLPEAMPREPGHLPRERHYFGPENMSPDLCVVNNDWALK